MRSFGSHRVPGTLNLGFPSQERQAHIRLSKLLAWKLPKSPARMWRTCVHSPAMHAEPGANAVGTPVGAPTCPPCVASIAGLVHVPGAQEPGLVESQPEFPGPQASTVPPPVTRQPAGTPSGCCASAT